MLWSDYIKYNWILISVHTHCYQGLEQGVEILQRLLLPEDFNCLSPRPALIQCCCVIFDQTSVKKWNQVRKSCKKSCWGPTINLGPLPWSLVWATTAVCPCLATHAADPDTDLLTWLQTYLITTDPSGSHRTVSSIRCCLGAEGCLLFLGFLRPWCHASVTITAGRSICFGMSNWKLQSKFLPWLQLMGKIVSDKTSGCCINTEIAEHSQQVLSCSEEHRSSLMSLFLTNNIWATKKQHN